MAVIISVLLASLLALATAQCNLQTVCYALDESGSISDADFDILQNFTVTTARVLKTLNPTTAYSAVKFDSGASLLQSTTTNLEGVFVPAVKNTIQSSGGTNIYAGLRECFTELQKSPAGGAKLIVLITDGQGNSGPNPIPAIRAANIAVLSVGVGRGIDVPFLKSVATNPNFYIPATFGNLIQLGSQVANKACDLIDIIMDPSPTPEVEDSCVDAFNDCVFTFNNTVGVPTFNAAGPPDVPFSSAIVPKMAGMSVGSLNSNNVVPEFIDINGAKEITMFGKQPFSPTQFKPYVGRGMLASFIGHETYQGNQESLVSGRCVRVYFTSFQILDVNGTVVDNKNNVPKSEKKCVVFQTL